MHPLNTLFVFRAFYEILINLIVFVIFNCSSIVLYSENVIYVS